MNKKEIIEALENLSDEEIEVIIKTATEIRNNKRKEVAGAIKDKIIELLNLLKPYVIPPYYFPSVVEDREGYTIDVDIPIELSEIITIIQEMEIC